MIGVSIQGLCQILPVGEDEDNIKQLSIIHPPSQHVYEYVMTPELAREIVDSLAMSNVDLKKKRDEILRAQKARELLKGEVGG